MKRFTKDKAAALGLAAAPLLCTGDTTYRAFYKAATLIINGLPFGCDQVSIYTINRDGTTLQEEAVAGRNDGQGTDEIPIYQLSHELSQRGRPIVRSHGTVHEVLAPIRLGDDFIGLLVLTCRNDVIAEQLDAISTFTAVLAPAVCYLLQARKDERTVHILQAATRMSRDLVGMSGLDSKRLLSHFVTLVVEKFAFDRALIVIFDPEKTTPIRAIGARIGQEPVPVEKERLPTIPPLGEDPVQLADAPGLWLPIRRGEQLLGVLLVDNLISLERLPHDTVQALLDLTAQVALILENNRLMDRLQTMAIRDDLTGLFRPGNFFERIQEELRRMQREKQRAALLFIDLNKFKAVNDTYGHQIGDAVLVHATQVLRSAMRANDVICRVGGDEFLVLVPRITKGDAILLAKRLKARLQHAVYTVPGGGDIHLSASIGIAMFPDDAGDWQTLIYEANQAMYAIKRGNEPVSPSRSN